MKHALRSSTQKLGNSASLCWMQVLSASHPVTIIENGQTVATEPVIRRNKSFFGEPGDCSV
jgi:hypothetical protein